MSAHALIVWTVCAYPISPHITLRVTPTSFRLRPEIAPAVPAFGSRSFGAVESLQHRPQGLERGLADGIDNQLDVTDSLACVGPQTVGDGFRTPFERCGIILALAAGPREAART